ncbi:hypothetical protein GCM10010915_11770 [Microbacterium faecale]|uniref:DUF732 domain-containing protein n=1 Tax=Microbacterium faecale TaxID=1804630 RepID=A0A916Y6Y3_9MICO|nr:hypothetical protein [Microbacterium faecale]GGD33039.1 hypothetical protein GCM10010915_11770 [Microbacterium faecale]
MKKSGIAAIAAAGGVILGGGAWAAVTLPVSDEATATAIETPGPTSEPREEATPTVEPTSAPTVEPTPEADLTGAQSQVVSYWIDRGQISEEDVITRLDETCAALADGAAYEDVVAFPDGTFTTNNDFRTDATAMWCPTD